MRLCKNCKYLKREVPFWHCNHPMAKKQVNLVTGTLPDCKEMRKDEIMVFELTSGKFTNVTKNRCQKSADWYEPKEQK